MQKVAKEQQHSIYLISPPSSLPFSVSCTQQLKKKMVDIDNGIFTIQYNIYLSLPLDSYSLQTLLTEIELQIRSRNSSHLLLTRLRKLARSLHFHSKISLNWFVFRFVRLCISFILLYCTRMVSRLFEKVSTRPNTWNTKDRFACILSVVYSLFFYLSRFILFLTITLCDGLIYAYTRLVYEKFILNFPCLWESYEQES